MDCRPQWSPGKRPARTGSFLKGTPCLNGMDEDSEPEWTSDRPKRAIGCDHTFVFDADPNIWSQPAIGFLDHGDGQLIPVGAVCAQCRA